MRLLRRLQYLLFQRRYERELAEEIESHREMLEDRQRASGLSEQDAGYAARRQMGNATLAREDARSVWVVAWFQSVLQDLGYAARSLRGQPAFTAFALLALALGTGVNTSLFMVYDIFVLRMWPVRDPGRVVRVSSGGSSAFSMAESRYLSAHSRSVEGIALERMTGVSLDGQADAPVVLAQFVGGNYFSLLGVDMALGRAFTAVEDKIEAPGAVAVLSYLTWQARYGADPGILGRQIRLNNLPFTVIGVVNKEFRGTSANYELWIPLASAPLIDPKARAWMLGTDVCCEMVARLAPRISREQARAELITLSRQFQNGIGKPPHDINLYGTTVLARGGEKQFYQLFFVLLVAFGSILLLACANVANLLLARAAARQREMAIRVCIGAGRARIVRQLLTESLLLAGLATGLGALLAWALIRVLGGQLGMAQILDWKPDLNVLGCAMAVAVASVLLFGLVPAVRSTRVSVNQAMKQQGTFTTPRSPSSGVLLVVQVAISVTLLACAGLLIRGLWHTRSLDYGFKINGVTTISVRLPPKSYDLERQEAFCEDVVRQMKPYGPVGAGVPWVSGRSMPVTLTGEKTADVRQVRYDYVNAGYFDVLGIPVVAGRNLVPSDRKARNILINEAMARSYWPGEMPMGKAIFDGGERLEVVGVVRDAQLAGPGPVEPAFFQHFDFGNLLAPTPVASMVAEAVRRAEPRAVVTLAPLSHRLDQFLQPARIAALVASTLGVLALLLATVGVYGMVSYSVEQRRREIGIRMALGARTSEILGLVLRRIARAVVCGLAVGLVVSLAASKVLVNLLYGVSRLDPLAHGAVLALMLAAAAAASAIPARRACRTDPVEALRHD